jgi:hypothetical protein
MAINVNKEGRPWSVSGGGPVLVIPAELAAEWRGTSPPVGAEVPAGWEWGQNGGPVCDYDRACKPDAFESSGFGGFGSVPVDDGHAIILGAEVVTEWHADTSCLIRKAYDESTPDAATAPWRPFPGVTTLTLRDGRLFFFDSAFAGAASPEAITAHDGVGVIQLEPGTYAIECAEDDGENDYVRFRRV